MSEIQKQDIAKPVEAQVIKKAVGKQEKYTSPGPMVDKNGKVIFYDGTPFRLNQRGN